MPALIAVVGPTASGKTALAKRIAQEIDGYCISADSRQIYRGMEIGTNAESIDLPSMPGFGVGIIEPEQAYSVAQFQSDVVDFMCLPRHRGKIPVIVGGTGQWVQALVDGWILPTVPPQPTLRAQLQKEYDERGLAPLVQRLQRQMSWATSSVDVRNPRRVIRALERTAMLPARVNGLVTVGLPVPVVLLGIDVPTDALEYRIQQRYVSMFERGWLEEVRTLLRRYPAYFPHGTDSNGTDSTQQAQEGARVPDAFRSIGYQELARHLRAPYEYSSERARQDIVHATAHYVRRQRTWWRRRSDVRWVSGIDEARTILRRSPYASVRALMDASVRVC